MPFLQTSANAQETGFSPLTLIMLVILAAMIFFMFRSSKKRKQQMAELQTKMAPGVQVMTNFGLFGELVSIDDDRNEAVIEVSPGNTVRVHRQVLARVVEDEPVDGAESVPTDDPGEQPGDSRDRA